MPAPSIRVRALKASRGDVLGYVDIAYTQDETGLHLSLPATRPGDYAHAFRITGLTL